jgi:hypothetical protein
MADRGIIFSAPMVRALLEGRKTQTRRLLRLRGRGAGHSRFGPSDTPGYDWHFRDRQMRWHDHTDESLRKLLPFAVGDRLWVRETWQADAHYDATKPRDIPASAAVWLPADDSAQGDGCKGKLRPSIFMPRWASRLTLTVTDIRVERLQAISEADAIAEGCQSTLNRYPDGGSIGHPATWHFEQLWQSLHGPKSWVANPWVVAITFEVVPDNIDRLAEPEPSASPRLRANPDPDAAA